jgi:hypothetical protein
MSKSGARTAKRHCSGLKSILTAPSDARLESREAREISVLVRADYKPGIAELELSATTSILTIICIAI